jgi:hypothetical protein
LLCCNVVAIVLRMCLCSTHYPANHSKHTAAQNCMTH